MRKKYVYCYNKYLLQYLLDKGFKPEEVHTNPKTNTEYRLFIRTDELTRAMDAYEVNLKNKLA